MDYWVIGSMTKYIQLGDLILKFKFLGLKFWSITVWLCRSLPRCQIQGKGCTFWGMMRTCLMLIWSIIFKPVSALMGQTLMVIILLLEQEIELTYTMYLECVWVTIKRVIGFPKFLRWSSLIMRNSEGSKRNSCMLVLTFSLHWSCITNSLGRR